MRRGSRSGHHDPGRRDREVGVKLVPGPKGLDIERAAQSEDLPPEEAEGQAREASGDEDRRLGGVPLRQLSHPLVVVHVTLPRRGEGLRSFERAVPPPPDLGVLLRGDSTGGRPLSRSANATAQCDSRRSDATPTLRQGEAWPSSQKLPREQRERAPYAAARWGTASFATSLTGPAQPRALEHRHEDTPDTATLQNAVTAGAARPQDPRRQLAPQDIHRRVTALLATGSS